MSRNHLTVEKTQLHHTQPKGHKEASEYPHVTAKQMQ